MPNKPRATPAAPSPMIGTLIVGLAALVYFAIFFLFSGEQLSRLALLFLMPFAVPSVLGEPGQLGGTLGLASRLPLLLAATAWCGVAYWLGHGSVSHVLQRINVDRWTISVPLSTLAGLSWLSTAVMLVGWILGTRSQLAMVLVICAALALGWVLRRRDLTDEPGAEDVEQQIDERWDKPFHPDNPGSLWLIRLLRPAVAALVGFYLLACTHPPLEFDVLEYHLQAPKEFYQLGEITFLPHNVYANMPLGAEIHSLAWMTLSGQESAWYSGALFGKAIIAIHTLLAALLVFGFVSQRFGADCGLLCGGLLLACGGVIHVSLDGLIDMVLGSYLLAFVALLALRIPDAEKMTSGRFWFLLATYAGAAAACKYTGYVLAVVPLGFLFVLQLRRAAQSPNRRNIFRYGASVLLGLCLTAVPWLVKNAVETGNPVYPLLSSVFPTPSMNAEQLSSWNRVHSPQAAGGFTISAATASLQQLLWKSPFLNPSLVFFALAAAFNCCHQLIQKRSCPEAIWWLTTMWILGAWWFLTHRIDRFWFPALPLLAVLAAFGISELTQRGSVVLVAAIGFFGIGFGLLQGLSGSTLFDNRIFVDLHQLQASQSGPIAYINSQVDATEHVLAIGEAKAFPFEPKMTYATCFNSNPGEDWLRDQSPEAQLESLRSRQISHVYVNWAEIQRYRSPGNYGFSDWPTRDDFAHLQSAGVLEPIPLPFEPDPRSKMPLFELYRVQ